MKTNKAIQRAELWAANIETKRRTMHLRARENHAKPLTLPNPEIVREAMAGVFNSRTGKFLANAPLTGTQIMEQLTQNQIKVLARKARHELASINEPMPYEDCDNTWTPPEYNWFGCESDAELVETLADAIGVEQSELLGEATLYHSIEVAYYG